jgi:hypothetical protein
VTHSDAGHYSAKHAPGESPDERIAGVIRGKAADGELACAEAERIGAALGVPLAEIGRTLDLLELRIGRCQLGLFGYPAGKALPRAAAVAVAPELEAAIRGRLADGRLPCKAAWEIAAEHKVAKIKISSACETLMIRIKSCQLGAF